ncbi:MAG TPA: ribbon-helix-helix protein, CopG family [Egibacteraceae bacterium]|nr:ribbon-helix-helix protein, CopG family [Egibacteraceae bacterium]
MAATRTQVYFTQRQRSRLDEICRRRGTTLAAIVREAIDAYLDSDQDFDESVAATFGALPDLSVPPRDEWDRG